MRLFGYLLSLLVIIIGSFAIGYMIGQYHCPKLELELDSNEFTIPVHPEDRLFLRREFYKNKELIMEEGNKYCFDVKERDEQKRQNIRRQRSPKSL